MVTDKQVRILMSHYQKDRNLTIAAAKSGMDRKTARKWLESDVLPSEIVIRKSRGIRKDPFEEVWDEVKAMLEVNPGLEAKTLFEYLQRSYPGKFSDGQLRTLQRRFKVWRATEGPPKEVFFPQVHIPGKLCASDFTHMTSLAVTIQEILFNHMIYHFVLTYSNWETGTICFSESFESLSEGFQNALWELGGVPSEHRTDRLSTAVHKVEHPEEFTDRYNALLSHYRIKARATNPESPNENGDAESLHKHFKNAVDQALMLRGSRDFETRGEYEKFLRSVFAQRNSGRRERLEEELVKLGRLPERKLDSMVKMTLKVGPSSTIRCQHNVYSVWSRLIGETVEARIYIDYIEIWYAQRLMERMPRLRGSGKHHINYRHIIDWLVRKPGAFENYRYREDLFPSSIFRIAYDEIKRTTPAKADREYLKVLYLAARENESLVEMALHHLLGGDGEITASAVGEIIERENELDYPRDALVDQVELRCYDELLSGVSS